MRWVGVSFWVLLAFTRPIAAADKTWVGGSSSNWFDGANWNPPGAPTSTETVAITNNFTTIVITDNVTLASLELRHAALVVSNQLTVTNLLLADGARLNAWEKRPSPITNPPAGFGIVEIPFGGRLQIGDSDVSSGLAFLTFLMEGTKLNLRGSGFCTNRATALLFYRSEFNVYGVLNLANEFTFDGANGPQAEA